MKVASIRARVAAVRKRPSCFASDALMPASATPREQIYWASVGQLSDGGVMNLALRYRGIGRVIPRHNH